MQIHRLNVLDRLRRSSPVGAIGGAISAGLNPIINSSGNLSPAALAGIETLVSGGVAGALGFNVQGAATAAQNETLNNFCEHNSCGNALTAFVDNVSNALNAGANVPAMDASAGQDVLAGMGNTGLNLASGSLPGMPDFTQYFQYNNPVLGAIGETYGTLGLGGLASSAFGEALATNSEVVPFSLPNGTTIEGVAADPSLAPAAPTQRYQITPDQAAQYLQQMGLPQSQIDSFVSSFQGPIYVRNALPGETFGAYSGGPENPASGQFLTPGTAGQTSGQVTNTLALPPSNPATTLNAATINQPIPVLEGVVAPQNWNGVQSGGGWQVFVPGGARYGSNPPVSIGPKLN